MKYSLIFYFIDFDLFTVRAKRRRNWTDKEYVENLTTELKMRTAHNQYEINSAIGTINTFIATKRDRKFDEVPGLCARLIRISNQHPWSEDHEKMKCDPEILQTNVLNHVKDELGEIKPPEPKPMKENDNAIYRELVNSIDLRDFHDCRIP